MTNAAGTTLTALFADGDGKVCSAVGLYAQLQQNIQVTVAGTGRQVLERLRESPPPDVLIVDMLLPDISVVALLAGVGRLCLKDPPAVLVTMRAPSEAMARRLLTAGADFFMLKPYRLEELLDTAIYLAADNDTLRQRRVRSHINWHLRAYRSPPELVGGNYIRWMAEELVLRDPNTTAEELYCQLAARYYTTPNTISKAVGRAVRAMWKQATPAYLELCRQLGESTNKPLSNRKFVMSLAERVRWELGL